MANRTGDRLRRRGFDLTRYDRETGHYRVRCSQCEALVINGVACHERGCPNQRKPKEDEDDGEDDEETA